MQMQTCASDLYDAGHISSEGVGLDLVGEDEAVEDQEEDVAEPGNV